MGKYKVGLDRPDVMEGVAFEVPPVGLIENKGHVVAELDDEVAASLKGVYGITVEKSSAPVSETNTAYPGYVYPEPTEEEAPPMTATTATVEVKEGGETE